MIVSNFTLPLYGVDKHTEHKHFLFFLNLDTVSFGFNLTKFPQHLTKQMKQFKTVRIHLLILKWRFQFVVIQKFSYYVYGYET